MSKKIEIKSHESQKKEREEEPESGDIIEKKETHKKKQDEAKILKDKLKKKEAEVKQLKQENKKLKDEYLKNLKRLERERVKLFQHLIKYEEMQRKEFIVQEFKDVKEEYGDSKGAEEIKRIIKGRVTLGTSERGKRIFEETKSILILQHLYEESAEEELTSLAKEEVHSWDLSWLAEEFKKAKTRAT